MFLLDLPLFARLAALALVGAGVGSVVNAAIYGLAWNRRRIGPWSARHDEAPDRRSSDFLPIVGWWGLRREAAFHGPAFWVRPALIELAWVVGLPWLYFRYVEQGASFPQGLALGTPEILWAHGLFAVHALLLAALCAATFIDFDEQTIPDEITVVGTLLFLGLSVFTFAHAPIAVSTGVAGFAAAPMLAPAPARWPPSFDGAWGLGYGLAIYAAWALALLSWVGPNVFLRTLSRRPLRAMKFLVAAPLRKRDRRLTALFGAILVVGLAAIYAVHAFAPEDAWRGLLTALFGLAFGGGLIWAIRVVASAALRQEAMGFGDVTLMAMIGACLGWQPALVTFFLAPFAAVVIALAQFAFTRRNDIAFGPYLSLGAAVAALFWAPIWQNWADDLFRMGIFIPQAVVACILLMGAMLFVWRLFKRNVLGIVDDPRARRDDGES